MTAQPPTAWEKTARWAAPLAAVAMLITAVWILFHQFRALSLHAVYAAILAQSSSRIGLSLALTAVSLAALASFDVFALKVARLGNARWGTAALAGAAANAISNLLGFHAVTASVVRYRLYTRTGLSPGDIARIISLSAAALGLGFVTMLAAALVLGPLIHQTFASADLLSLAAGVALFLSLATLIVWLSRGQRTLRIAAFHITLPPARLALLQMGIGAIEAAAAIGALYVLLPGDLAPSFAAFSIAMIVAVILGVASHAPAGLGAFDATIVAVIGGGVRADLIAALLLYRMIYYVTPFIVAAIAMALFEVFTKPSVTLTG